MVDKLVSGLMAAVLAAACSYGAAPASAASLPASSTALLTGAPSLFEALPTPVGGSYIRHASVSADGRYVAFSSESDGLMAGDNNTVDGVYRKDMQTGVVVLVSRRDGTDGAANDDDCYDASISDDGNRVAFACDSSLHDDDTNDASDIYLRDIGDDATYLVSRVGNLGAPANNDSWWASLSADGTFVAFTSESTNLGVASGEDTVYRRRMGGGNETIVVSRKPASAGGEPVEGDEGSISDDGNKIAFTAYDDLGGADDNGSTDVYVRDVNADATILASRRDGAGPVGDGTSDSPAIAGNGASVVFESNADNLAGIDKDGKADIYRRTLAAEATLLVSIDNDTAVKAEYSRNPSVDASGNVIGFLSAATTLVGDDTDRIDDVYVKNVVTNDVLLVSRADGEEGQVANAHAETVSVSGDGARVVSELERGAPEPGVDPRQRAVILRDIPENATYAVARPPGDAPFVNAGGASESASLSTDGRFAAFTSDATAFGLPAGVRQGIFVRDRVTGAVTLASRMDGPGGAAFTEFVQDPSISGDGRRVAFTVHHETGQDQTKSVVYVRDLVEGRTFLASRADGAGGPVGDRDAERPALNADGTRVAFVSEARNLVPGDAKSDNDIYVRDLAAGRTILASVATDTGGTTGPKADNDSYDPAINGDGTRVAFISYAKNLAGTTDNDNLGDVYLRDLAAGTTRLVSTAPGGPKANETSSSTPSLDAAGTRVAFITHATNLAGATYNGAKVLVRDLAAESLVLASRGDGPDGAGADTGTWDMALSPDGGYVVFGSFADNLVPGVTGPRTKVYRRDLARGRTELVSRRDGPAGAPTTYYAYAADVSSGGACVAFSSREGLIGAHSDFDQVYLRTFEADCGDPPPAPDGGAPQEDVPPAGSAPEPIRPVAAADTVAPVISAARLARRRFRVARAATALAAARRGTTLRFRSSEAGTLTIAIERATRRSHRRAGQLTRRIAAGEGRTALSGRLGRRRMRAGRYRLTLTASDAAGNRSKPVRLTFVIVG